MNKVELIKQTASKCDTSEVRTREILNAFTEVITEALQNGEAVNFTGFGKFYMADYKAREIKSPEGELIKVKATKSPRFRASRTFKDSCRP